MPEVKGGYQLPATSNYVSSSWQDHKNRRPPSQEPGTDYGIAYGSTLRAPEDGYIEYVKTSASGAMGRVVKIRLNDGQSVRYLHLSRITVNSGQKVRRGDVVGYSGASANGKDWGVGAHVHVTLMPGHADTFGNTLDFARQVGADNDITIAFSQKVANEQNFLNAAQGEKLVVDGLAGPLYRAAVGRYQQYLKGRGWYDGEIDNAWGPKTQAGHEKRYAEWVAQTTPKPNPAYHRATVADLAELQWVNGLQKIAHLYGYGKGQAQSTWMDNKWGGGSQAGLQRFLDQNHGGSLAAWLRAKWGYTDNDDLWGPNMKAAAARAEAENYKAL
ncbi:M23 family metallopeptidase [Microbacterium kunmingense]|uniref:M23 family metallopeptidase n=1 Tax=Microbacterium kunmingense TaxID=2915939 RepID=UPI002004015D|nr:M23 family metallopeptidase [Microbacterium kunmingense]